MKINLYISNFIRKFIYFIKRDYIFDFLIIIYIIISIYWSYISLLKYYSLNDSVWDLGVAYLTGIEFLKNPFDINNLIFHPILFLIFPIFLNHSMVDIIIFQNFSVLFGSLVLYFISKEILKNRLQSFLISLVYLFYPPLTGIFWFDFHYQVFFIPFYLLGYYFFIKKMYKTSIFFFIFGGESRFPYILLVSLTGFIFLSEEYVKMIRKKEFSREKLFYSLILFLISLSILLISYVAIKIYFGGGNLISVLQSQAHYTGVNNSILDYRIFMIFIILFPLLGFPLLSKRFLLLYLPFLYITLYISYWGVVFPGFLERQYSPLYIPFLFLATIEVLNEFIKENNKIVYIKKINLSALFENKTKITALMLILTILLGLVYQPWGPFNELSLASFNVSHNLNPNYDKYNELMNIIKLIPDNAWLLVQNNLPEAYYRINNPNDVFVPGFVIFSKNFTYNNEYVLINNYWMKMNFTYVLMDMDSLTYYINYILTSMTMYEISNKLFKSNHYGIIAEYDGIVLLKENYYGNILIYKPIFNNININQNFSKTIFIYNLNLTPGIYKIELTGHFYNKSSINISNSINSTELTNCTFNSSEKEDFLIKINSFVSGGFIEINNTKDSYLENITIEEIQPIVYHNQTIAPGLISLNFRQVYSINQQVQNYSQQAFLDSPRRVKY